MRRPFGSKMPVNIGVRCAKCSPGQKVWNIGNLSNAFISYLMPASPAESCLYEILVGRTVLARVLAASAAVSFRQSVPTRCRLECRGCCPRPPLGAQAESLEAFAPAVAVAECAAPMACEDAEPLLPCRRCSVPRSCL